MAGNCLYMDGQRSSSLVSRHGFLFMLIGLSALGFSLRASGSSFPCYELLLSASACICFVLGWEPYLFWFLS